MDVDALILARAAEVNDGLVSMLGGGWMRCAPPPQETYPFVHVVVVVATLRVGYAETNAPHRFGLEIRDSDEIVLGPSQANGDFNVGRPHDLTPGMSQVVQFAIPMPVELAKPGIYSVVLTIDDGEARRIQFEALPQPSAPAMQ